MALALLLILAGAAVAQSLATADDVLERMDENTHGLEDLDAFLTIETYEDGVVEFTQRLRLSLLQPDRMRQEYLAPEYLAGNLTLTVGDDMWIYIAAVDTWYEKDLSELSSAEQPWLAFRRFLHGVDDELDDYAFELLGVEDGTYHLAGVAAVNDATYGRIELWVDAEAFVPIRRLLYDVDYNLLIELRIFDIERVAESTYLARTMETYDEAGVLRSAIHYDELVVNSGLDSVLFERVANDEGDGDV
jgi:outer membrane lipoprotein-sorting protein